MSSSSALQSCTVCYKGNANFCARCKCSSYCSKTCQQSDWSTHKLLCAAFTSFATSNRPTPDHYRAVLFNPDKTKPEFTWLLCKWTRDDDDECDYQMPETNTIIGSDTLVKHVPIRYNSRLNKNLSNTIIITYRDTFLEDGSRPSRSIAAITATQAGDYHDWRGPIVAYARKG
ncbi:hypothetical protein K505DRAFT_251192, partial [Melanomma pulvis-pyrius CBS 109.77]